MDRRINKVRKFVNEIAKFLSALIGRLLEIMYLSILISIDKYMISTSTFDVEGAGNMRARDI